MGKKGRNWVGAGAVLADALFLGGLRGSNVLRWPLKAEPFDAERLLSVKKRVDALRLLSDLLRFPRRLLRMHAHTRFAVDGAAFGKSAWGHACFSG